MKGRDTTILVYLCIIAKAREIFVDILLASTYVYTNMATLQKRKSRGHTYWSIVESRRINGKPRPVILAYLGRAEDLLKRLTEGMPHKVKSYSHGAVAALLDIARQLQVVEIINRHLPISLRKMRNGFTVGGTLLLAALGRACQPTSKDNWYEGFARHTSLSLLLRMSLNKLESQHFWDQMDAVPVSSLPLIEKDLVLKLIEEENLELDTLLCDTSNFFTYIASTNGRCTLPQRGKNKQRRIDLRQVGLLLMVSRRHHLPLFHSIYQGNLQDRSVFKEHLPEIVNRFKAISGSLEDITLVFDQGNNSKKTLLEVDEDLHFVGALSPYQHKSLIEKANSSMRPILVSGREMNCYRERTKIWGLDLTAVVYISETLLQGQIRGIHQDIGKLFSSLEALKEKIKAPTRNGRKRVGKKIVEKITSLISSHNLDDLICWDLEERADKGFDLTFSIDEEQFEALQDSWLGRRILITNRHGWSEEEIISAYWGQSQVEYAFKNMKNPFHLAFRPQYHWTDQKIEVHGFICLLAFLLTMVAFKRAKGKIGFTGSPHSLLEKLSAVRLATFVESPAEKTKGRYKAVQRIEEMDEDVAELAGAFDLLDKEFKTDISFSVYNR
jgi:transposase